MPEVTPFVHVTVQNADLYRAVMRAFVRAKAVAAEFVPAPDQTAVTEALASLARWGNLRAEPDTSQVTTVGCASPRRADSPTRRRGRAGSSPPGPPS